MDLLHEHDASHRDNPFHAGRAAERLLYISASCPEQFFYIVEHTKPTDWFSRWRTALRDNATLPPREKEALIGAAKAAAFRQGAQGKRTAQLLSGVSTAPLHTMQNQCGAVFRHLLIGLSDDWMARSGALWFDYSDSMLFMLASCQEDSYYVLGQRPEILSSWLQNLPNASFWGGPEITKDLQALQQSLIRLLKVESPPEYLRTTHDRILNRLEKLCVTAIDVMTPCEAQAKE